MNDQQREYAKILIGKHKKSVSDLYYKINRNGVFAFCGLGIAIAKFAVGGEITPNETVDNFIGLISGATVIINGICAVNRIVERENLKQRILQIEYDLKMDELKEEHPKVYQKTRPLEK